MLRSSAAAVALLAVSCSRPTPSFRAGFAEGVRRVWIGPDFYGNRLQDWRLAAGRVEAVEGRRAKPMRTLSILTVSLREEQGNLSLEVRTGALSSGPPERDTWSGFLIGAGGSAVDYRVTALVHHWPSTDGGLIVGVDGTGDIIVRDNSVNQGYRGPDAAIPLEAWPLVEPVERRRSSGPVAAYRLSVEAAPDSVGYRLRVEAWDDETGDLVAAASYAGLLAGQFDGGVALVSHRSAAGAGPGYWFDDLAISGSKLELHPERAFGPIMGAFHTVSEGTLKLTAQFGPLGITVPATVRDTAGSSDVPVRRPAPLLLDNPTAHLDVLQGDRWKEVAVAPIDPRSYTATFRVEPWDGAAEAPYRVGYDLVTGPGSSEFYEYRGTIRRPPSDKDEFVLAAFTGHSITGGDGQWNHQHFWYPHNELVAAVEYHEPDMLFFSGDQIYEAGLAGVVREPPKEAELDYLYHWYRFVWAFRDLARDRPTVMTPDDHDVYQGNIWGNAGRSFEGDYAIQDRGGYRMAPEWVNVVHRTQVSNLPDPVDPAPLANGITVYYTRIEYAGLSFAVVADRMFKSPPAPLLPNGRVVNGWFQNPDFDPVTEADAPGAELLGPRQERFLDEWVDDWSSGAWMKVLLSQTPLVDVATIPDSASSGSVLPSLSLPAPGEYVRGDKKAADADSDGWPQSGRNRVLRTLRRGFAFHVAGDQHLGSLVHYGVDEFNDAGYGFAVPSIANFWPRRWFPPQPGAHRAPGAPAYTGEHLDGFGNRMTVLAVANPMRSGAEPRALYDRTPGYGIVRFRRSTREITVEMWPRWVDPKQPGASQYPGWPQIITQLDNYGRRPAGYLATLSVAGMDDPVVQVVDEADGSVVYTVRVVGREFRPPVFRRSASYTVRVGEPGTPRMTELTGLSVSADPDATVTVTVSTPAAIRPPPR